MWLDSDETGPSDLIAAPHVAPVPKSYGYAPVYTVTWGVTTDGFTITISGGDVMTYALPGKAGGTYTVVIDHKKQSVKGEHTVDGPIVDPAQYLSGPWLRIFNTGATTTHTLAWITSTPAAPSATVKYREEYL